MPQEQQPSQESVGESNLIESLQSREEEPLQGLQFRQYRTQEGHYEEEMHFQAGERAERDPYYEDYDLTDTNELVGTMNDADQNAFALQFVETHRAARDQESDTGKELKTE